MIPRDCARAAAPWHRAARNATLEQRFPIESGSRSMKKETIVTTAGRHLQENFGIVNPPVYRARRPTSLVLHHDE
jgi:hypothetical protein